MKSLKRFLSGTSQKYKVADKFMESFHGQYPTHLPRWNEVSRHDVATGSQDVTSQSSFTNVTRYDTITGSGDVTSQSSYSFQLTMMESLHWEYGTTHRYADSLMETSSSCASEGSARTGGSGSGFYPSSHRSSQSSDGSGSGYVPLPRPLCMGEVITRNQLIMGHNDAKVMQFYKAQLKISVYVNHGLLTVHVMQARYLAPQSRPYSNSYVKLSLVPDESKRTKCKTEVVHDTNNPLYDEKFSFELLEEDIKKRLLISVWHKTASRDESNEFLGCMSFGIKSIQPEKRAINGWYCLLPEELGRKKHQQVAIKPAHLRERCTNVIPQFNQDVMWMDSHTVTLKKAKSGYGFAVVGACPVQISRVDTGTPAEQAGLCKDDFIIKVDGVNVSRSTSDSVAKLIKHSKKHIQLEIQRPRSKASVQRNNVSPWRPNMVSTPMTSQAGCNTHPPTSGGFLPPAPPPSAISANVRSRQMSDDDLYYELQDIQNCPPARPMPPQYYPAGQRQQLHQEQQFYSSHAQQQQLKLQHLQQQQHLIQQQRLEQQRLQLQHQQQLAHQNNQRSTEYLANLRQLEMQQRIRQMNCEQPVDVDFHKVDDGLDYTMGNDLEFFKVDSPQRPMMHYGSDMSLKCGSDQSNFRSHGYEQERGSRDMVHPDPDFLLHSPSCDFHPAAGLLMSGPSASTPTSNALTPPAVTVGNMGVEVWVDDPSTLARITRGGVYGTLPHRRKKASFTDF